MLKALSSKLFRAVSKFQSCFDHNVLHTVVTIHLVEQQSEGFAAYLLQVLTDERDTWMRHLLYPVAHIAQDRHLFRDAFSAIGQSLQG